MTTAASLLAYYRDLTFMHHLILTGPLVAHQFDQYKFALQ